MNFISVDWNIGPRCGQSRQRSRSLCRTYEPVRESPNGKSRAQSNIARNRRTLMQRPNRWVSRASAPHEAKRDAATRQLPASLARHGSQSIDAEDRANTTLDLTQLAAALAVYRAEHGEYPTSSMNSSPTCSPQLPVDLYHAKPFIYHRRRRRLPPLQRRPQRHRRRRQQTNLQADLPAANLRNTSPTNRPPPKNKSPPAPTTSPSVSPAHHSSCPRRLKVRSDGTTCISPPIALGIGHPIG